jgi:hypothetical protein
MAFASVKSTAIAVVASAMAFVAVAIVVEDAEQADSLVAKRTAGHRVHNSYSSETKRAAGSELLVICSSAVQVKWGIEGVAKADWKLFVRISIHSWPE